MSFITSSLEKSLPEKRIFSCGTIIRNRKEFPSDLKNIFRITEREYFIWYVLVLYFKFNLISNSEVIQTIFNKVK